MKGKMSPSFQRYIGIDYSGAKTPNAPLPGLRVYRATAQDAAPKKVRPQPLRPEKNWTRPGVAEWLIKQLSDGMPTLVGIDHGFSFPECYFKKHDLHHNWQGFLEDFHKYWPTDEVSVQSVLIENRKRGKHAARMGCKDWFRVTEKWTAGAKSVFDFESRGAVAWSTHAGLPWLLKIRRAIPDRVHFWPFDGWKFPARRSVIAEVYPSLWHHRFERETRTKDQHDAYSVAKWLRRADSNGSLPSFLQPPLTPEERKVAQIEGWILGVL
jgi:hypothetical protein